MRRTSFLLVCASAVLFAVGVSWPGTLWADHQRGHGNNGKGKHAEAARDTGRASYAWTDRDHCRVVVRDYYRRGDLPPGLAKKQALPPGLQKQLRERGHLPPGLEKRLVPLPVQLEHSLPPLPPHHVWRAAGDDLLVIDTHAHLVVSIMAGVFIAR